MLALPSSSYLQYHSYTPMATTTMAVSPQRCWLAVAVMLSVFVTGQATWLDLSGLSASQSSTYTGHVGGDAARAIDGNLDTDYAAGSCTHTNQDNSPWWQVRLAGETTVTAVKVTNRGDTHWTTVQRLDGLQVTVNGQLCASGVTFSRGETKEITCIAPVTGTDVRLEIPGRNEVLTLCEVGVRGVSTISLTASPMVSPAVTYTLTNGYCRGGPDWPGTRNEWRCVGNRLDEHSCAAECNADPRCGAYDMEPGGAAGECCLFQPGNTGNGDRRRHCWVMNTAIPTTGAPTTLPSTISPTAGPTGSTTISPTVGPSCESDFPELAAPATSNPSTLSPTTSSPTQFTGHGYRELFGVCTRNGNHQWGNDGEGPLPAPPCPPLRVAGDTPGPNCPTQARLPCDE